MEKSLNLGSELSIRRESTSKAPYDFVCGPVHFHRYINDCGFWKWYSNLTQNLNARKIPRLFKRILTSFHCGLTLGYSKRLQILQINSGSIKIDRDDLNMVLKARNIPEALFKKATSASLFGHSLRVNEELSRLDIPRAAFSQIAVNTLKKLP